MLLLTNLVQHSVIRMIMKVDDIVVISSSKIRALMSSLYSLKGIEIIVMHHQTKMREFGLQYLHTLGGFCCRQVGLVIYKSVRLP